MCFSHETDWLSLFLDLYISMARNYKNAFDESSCYYLSAAYVAM